MGDLHPRALAASLKKLNEKSSPPAAIQQFLNKLYNGAKRVSRQANDYATIKDIYELFTYAPGYEKENNKASFAQQLYALDKSEIRTTKDNKVWKLESPSGANQKAEFSVIADDGSPINYYAIWFG